MLDSLFYGLADSNNIKCSNPVIATSSKPTPPIATTKANGTKDYWNVVIQNWLPYSFHKNKVNANLAIRFALTFSYS
mgnify:CR=1 FL=1